MEKPSAALQAKTQKIRELQPTTITERPAYLKKNVAEKGESLTEFSHLISAEKKKAICLCAAGELSGVRSSWDPTSVSGGPG